MATAKKTPKKGAETVTESNGRNPILKTIRTVLLAAIGTVAMGKEEIEAIVNRLVEKGEIAEKDGRELVNELLDRRKKDVEKVEDVVEERAGLMDQRIESVLNRMNIPSKSDVESLSRKIGSLSQKVDELNKKIEA